MTRLKALFPKIDKREIGKCWLLDTPENARDLAWFLDRYPLTVPELDRLRAAADLHRQYELRVQGILAGEIQAGRILTMALPPRPYQQIAAHLVTTTGRLLLGDDVGLGKTCAGIAAIATSGKLPALIVTLTHLPTQWEREFARFLPSVTVHTLKKATPYEYQADVTICNYHKLNGWAEHLKGRMKTVIFDEAQELRRAESNGEPTKKYAAASAIAQEAEIRMQLTATPIYNYGGEILNLLNILEKDCLGSADEAYREWCCGSGDKASIRDPIALGTHLRDAGIMLRRTRKDVGRELPALSIIPYEIEADKKILDACRDDVVELARRMLDADNMERGDKFKAAGQFDFRLRRATGMAKAHFVADFVKMLVESGESVVLYGWHHDVYAVWVAALKDLRPALYTGEQSAKQKNDSIARFISGDTKVAILSLRSGAGLDGLQNVCRTVVFGELDWSPGVHLQCAGRIHRDGQAEPVCAYFLHSDRGSDPVVMDVLGVKKGQMEGLIDPDAELVEASINPDHLKRLAQSFLDQAENRMASPKPVAVKPAWPPETVPKLKPKKAPVPVQADLFDEVAS